MSRIKKINNNKSWPLDYNLSVDNKDGYGVNIDQNIDWQADQDLQMEPSKNDYNKGYAMDPYEMRYWANRNILHQVKQGENYEKIAEKYFGHKSFNKEIAAMNKEFENKVLQDGMMLIVGRKPLKKEAHDEIRNITYTPDNLAKEILTLWSQVDGPLQNFFDAFTMNKMTNKMKKEISNILNEWGYDVKPVITDETPRFAGLNKKSLSKISKLSKEKDIELYFKEINKVYPQSKIASNILEDIVSSKDSGIIIKKAEALGLLDYYKMIFPNDYASSLITVTFDNSPVGMGDLEQTDVDISNENLEQMEKMDSGNQDPLPGPKDGGPGGYDFTTQMRPDSPGGVSPTSYETGPFNVYDRKAKRLKKKK